MGGADGFGAEVNGKAHAQGGGTGDFHDAGAAEAGVTGDGDGIDVEVSAVGEGGLEQAADFIVGEFAFFPACVIHLDRISRGQIAASLNIRIRLKD